MLGNTKVINCVEQVYFLGIIKTNLNGDDAVQTQ